ncbi:MAG: hypothetical protein AAGH74_01865, partial [Pseudomonadota bacterium]
MRINPDPENAPQVQLRQLFATPIALFRLPNYTEINTALEEVIFKREAEVASVHHSNWGGWQSPTDFADWCGPAGQT